jgi:hypothetical protein
VAESEVQGGVSERIYRVERSQGKIQESQGKLREKVDKAKFRTTR